MSQHANWGGERPRYASDWCRKEVWFVRVKALGCKVFQIHLLLLDLPLHLTTPSPLWNTSFPPPTSSMLFHGLHGRWSSGEQVHPPGTISWCCASSSNSSGDSTVQGSWMCLTHVWDNSQLLLTGLGSKLTCLTCLKCEISVLLPWLFQVLYAK